MAIYFKYRMVQFPVDLLTTIFPERWTIEEFFNFNGDMGWNRASTFNLNIKYGKQTMALMALQRAS